MQTAERRLKLFQSHKTNRYAVTTQLPWEKSSSPYQQF